MKSTYKSDIVWTIVLHNTCITLNKRAFAKLNKIQLRVGHIKLIKGEIEKIYIVGMKPWKWLQTTEKRYIFMLWILLQRLIWQHSLGNMLITNIKDNNWMIRQIRTIFIITGPNIVTGLGHSLYFGPLIYASIYLLCYIVIWRK